MQLITRSLIKYKGFNLIELLILIALMSISLTFVLPEFSSYFNKRRITGVADNVNFMFKLARSEAAKKNRDVHIFINNDSDDWCLGLSGDDDGNDLGSGSVGANDGVSDDCDCTVENTCTVDGIERVVSIDDYPGIFLNSSSFSGDKVSIEPTRGRNSQGSMVFAISDGSLDVKLTRSIMGRLTLCSPSSSELRFAKC